MKRDAKLEFRNHIINSRVLKTSRQRNLILDEFLKHGQSMNVDELFGKLRSRHSKIGYSTVYRTLKLLAASGVAKEIRIDNGAIRYLFDVEET